ncbi:hypothetical protein PJF56_18210 [Roseofilum sp. BLCC_M91]|uniref:Uncharacterized protein n=1 Tax=Roseofilum halophilum BLCC-M91 TaxID=3022259 RepID=A0ABT7BNM6_9CYAN|nr:hypothetical protein [Roseofilum halophilum]MDJ1180797.1 hypothetical protein [Roseofilum halophilum BLCC-M91]
MLVPQPRPKSQPGNRGSNQRGGRKIPSLSAPPGEGPIDAIKEALAGPPLFHEQIQDAAGFWGVPLPKIPNPFTRPREREEKDIESLGEAYPDPDPELTEEEPIPMGIGGYENTPWGNTGKTIGAVAQAKPAPTFPPEWNVPQPEGIYIPPFPSPGRDTSTFDVLGGRPGVYIGVSVKANRENRYSSPGFPDDRRMYFYFLARENDYLSDGWPQQSGPKVRFKGVQHWKGYIRLAERLLSKKLSRYFDGLARSSSSPIRATYRLLEDGSWSGPHTWTGSATRGQSGYNFYFTIEAQFERPPVAFSPFPRQRGEKMSNCCPTLIRNQNRMIKDLKLIKTWVGADYKEVEVPRHPFMDTSVGFLGKILGKGTRKISSLPDLIMYFIQSVDTMFGDEFPMKVKVPTHIVEGAKASGIGSPEEFELITPGEAIRAIFEATLNLQDDEGNAKALMTKCLLEAYKAREEAYKARNMLDQFVKWTGIETEEVKNFLQAEFTLPETDNDPNNAISWEDWKKKYPNPDEELKAFLEPSKMAIKGHYFDPEKGRDLIDDLYLLRNIYQIVRAAHTISVGKNREGMRGKLADYLLDFGAKYAYHAATAPAEREKRGIGEDEEDDGYDPKGLKDFRKFRKVVEGGLVSPTEKDTSIKSRKDRPYGRHPEETAKIRDITDGSPGEL